MFLNENTHSLFLDMSDELMNRLSYCAEKLNKSSVEDYIIELLNEAVILDEIKICR